MTSKNHATITVKSWNGKDLQLTKEEYIERWMGGDIRQLLILACDTNSVVEYDAAKEALQAIVSRAFDAALI